MNTILNLVLVIVFHMSVAGVAIATSIANAVSAGLIVYMLLHEKDPYQLKRLHIEWRELKRMLQIGIPAGVQGMVFSLSNVVVQTAINGYGYGAIAGSAAAVNFEYYCYFLIAAFNGAAISFIGQNYGAGKLDRVNRVFWICLGLAALTCALANWSFTWQYHYVLSLFSTDPTVIDYGNIRMHTALAFQFIAATYEISGSAMRGMGKSVEPTIITIIGTCLLRMVWVFMILPQYNDFFYLMMVYPISWAITGTLMLILYAAHWRKVKKMAL